MRSAHEGDINCGFDCDYNVELLLLSLLRVNAALKHVISPDYYYFNCSLPDCELILFILLLDKGFIYSTSTNHGQEVPICCDLSGT